MLNGSDEKLIFLTPLLNSESEIDVWTYMLGNFLLAYCLSPRIRAIMIKLIDEYLNWLYESSFLNIKKNENLIKKWVDTEKIAVIKIIIVKSFLFH